MSSFGINQPTKSDIQSAPSGIMMFVTKVSEHSNKSCPNSRKPLQAPVIDSTHSVISTDAIAVTISTLWWRLNVS